MITLTERAARQVQSMHAAQGDAQKKLRIFVESGGCSGFEYGMSFDLPKAEDNVLRTSHSIRTTGQLPNANYKLQAVSISATYGRTVSAPINAVTDY